jgi:hypothetical protein
MPITHSVSGHRLRYAAVGVVIGLGACAAVVWNLTHLYGSGDYQPAAHVIGDNAGPAVAALAHGHPGRVISVQPLMGLVSLVWRAPFVALGSALGGGDRLIYALGCAACLLPALGLIAWLVRRADSPRRTLAAAVAAAVMVAGPATIHATHVGHPEEVLATVLATGAVISASANRRGWAAVLLGLAIGSKQWALLATPCVLVALPDHRAAVAVRAGLIAAAAIVVLPLASPAAFAHADASVGNLRTSDPFSVWWPVSPRPFGAVHAFTARFLPLNLTRSEAAAFALVLAGAVLYAYGRRVGAGRMPPVDGLALLALLGLLRCVCDPDPLTYNFVAAVIPLVVWEAGVRRRLPVVSVAAWGLFALLPSGGDAFDAGLDPVIGQPAAVILWLAAMAALGCYLARASFAVPTAELAPVATPGLPLWAATERA